MALRPEIRRYLRASAPLHFPAEALADAAVAASYLERARAPRAMPAAEPVGDVVEACIVRGLPVRIYRPAARIGPVPTVLFLHGGGWVLGSLDSGDAICRRLCNVSPAVVVNLDYRLAPEYPFPAALEDAYAAIKWILEDVGAYGGDPERLVLMGTSAGGNLAAACALMARDQGGPPITLQVLGYPVTDSSMASTSYQQNGNCYLLSADQMRWFWEQYVPDEADRTHPLASPLYASSLAGLPAAIVITAEFDPLRDEGELYARRLAAEGVHTELTRYDGQVHGFLGMLGLTGDADRAIAAIGTRIRECAAARSAGPDPAETPEIGRGDRHGGGPETSGAVKVTP